jgi:hypothetical protein
MAVDRTAGGRYNKRSGKERRRAEASTSSVRSRRRSGGRGQVSGKRRRNGQPVDDIRIWIRKALLEMKSGEKASLEMKSDEKLCWR